MTNQELLDIYNTIDSLNNTIMKATWMLDQTKYKLRKLVDQLEKHVTLEGHNIPQEELDKLNKVL